MRKFILFIMFAFFVCGCTSKDHLPEQHLSYSSPRPVVLASQDATMALGRILAVGTQVDVVRAVLPGYSMRGHAAYYRKHWKTFEALSRNADAVLTTAAAWPGDPLYPWARRADVRIAQVDVTRPLDGSRAGVPLMYVPGSRRVSPYVWNSPGNFARMADIAAADMQELYPDEADVIQGNVRALKQALFRLRTSFEARLGMLDAYEVVALTPDFAYLTDEFGIEVVEYMTRPEHRWADKDLDALQKALEAGGVKAVICAWQPGEAILDVITRAGARAVVLDVFASGDNPTMKTVTEYYESNLNRLLAALSGSAG